MIKRKSNYKQEGRRALNRWMWGLILLVLSPILISIPNIGPLGWMFLIFSFILLYPEISLLIKWVWKKIKRKQHQEALPEKIREITEEIEKFTPSKNWSSEEGYQGELQGYLKQKFPSSLVEVQTGASRPDIVIDNVAIEVKGPTDDNAINSIPAKCLKYSKHYDHLIFVLFRPTYSKRNYDAIMNDLKMHFPNIDVITK
jgi:hypothetical protein